MRKISMIAAATAMTAGSLAVAAPASAHHNYRHSERQAARYDDGRYYGRTYARPVRCKSGTTGAIVGGAAGALLGREVAGRGDRTLGTVLGGAAGALLGREVTRTKRCYR